MLQSHTSWAQQHHHVAVVTSITPNNGNPINLQSKEICPNTKLLLRGKEREKKQNIFPLPKNCHTRQKKATEKNSGKHVTVSPKKKNEENIIACGWGKTFFSTDFFFFPSFGLFSFGVNVNVTTDGEEFNDCIAPKVVISFFRECTHRKKRPRRLFLPFSRQGYFWPIHERDGFQVAAIGQNPVRHARTKRKKNEKKNPI